VSMTTREPGSPGDGPAFHFSPKPNRAHEIDWREWGDEAFRLAQTQDRLILLDITAVWCHWCHVMDETSYSDQAVIDLVNQRFVAIRVDNDRRPDVNERYNMGGWPTTAILTPGGDILTGTTYLPPRELHQILLNGLTYYQENKPRILAHSAEIAAARQMPATPRSSEGPANESIVHNALAIIRQDYDPQYGGFGSQPKFPHADALELALFWHIHSGEAIYRTIVAKTLDRMSRGGTFDQVAGGFFRYSTTRDWSVPHFEKMLEDNAVLAKLYLQAHQALGEKRYLETAGRIFGYLRETLYDPQQGVFFGSQDADEHYYGLDVHGRAGFAAPYIDRTIYSGWNALVASAFLEAERVTGDPQNRETALQVLDLIWRMMWDDKEGVYHFFDGTPHVTGLLGDQVAVAGAFLDAYENTGQSIFLDQAIAVAVIMEKRLYDPVDSGFFDIPQGHQSVGGLVERHKAIVDNSSSATLFLRLAAFTGLERYRDVAQSTLNTFSDESALYRLFASSYALAVHRSLHHPVAVTIVGEPKNARVVELLRAALSYYDPTRLVQVIDPSSDWERLERLGYSTEPAPLAYICVGQTCGEPTDRPEDVRPRIEKLTAR
jgi:uncharacterized protein